MLLMKNAKEEAARSVLAVRELIKRRRLRKVNDLHCGFFLIFVNYNCLFINEFS